MRWVLRLPRVERCRPGWDILHKSMASDRSPTQTCLRGEEAGVGQRLIGSYFPKVQGTGFKSGLIQEMKKVNRSLLTVSSCAFSHVDFSFTKGP